MTDQQNHLKQVLEQQKTLVAEINELNSAVESKKSMALKLQGVLEYLQQLGIELPKDCLLYTSPSPRDLSTSRMPSSA